jgi:hypothetical protein
MLERTVERNVKAVRMYLYNVGKTALATIKKTPEK